ncbi:MAG: hypothetical protein IJ316_00660 [Clostridia bacterium]|nr:hypothetical protein [Clostridia bacterium]
MAGFFDNVLNKLNSGIEKVADNSKTMVEKSKLNSAIKKLEAEKHQILESIGATLYQFMIDTSEGDFPREEAFNLCTLVAQKDQEIADLRTQIAALEETAPVQQAAMPQENAGQVCTCGFVNAPGAQFCVRCGNKFE